MIYRIIISFCIIFNAVTFGKKSKIIGGTDTSIEEFPCLASLRRVTDNEHLCAGAIIGHRFILTVAHCVHESKIKLSDIKVHVGTSDPSGMEGLWYHPDKYYAHPEFSISVNQKINAFMDIAIVKLHGFIEFNKYQNKVELPIRQPFDQDLGMLGGWGATTYPTNFASNILQKTWMTIVNNYHCENQVSFKVNRDQFCAYQKKNVGPCIGDSGSPLIGTDGRILGLVTVTIPCATGVPDLYTSIFYHLGFIKSIIEYN